MKKISALWIAVVILFSFCFSVAAWGEYPIRNTDISEEQSKLQRSCKSNSTKSVLIHAQDNGITLSRDVDGIIGIPLSTSSVDSIRFATININSTDNIEIVSNAHFEIEISTGIFFVEIKNNSNVNSDSEQVYDIGKVNIVCTLANEYGDVQTSTLNFNVLISSKAVILGEYGIDTIELYYYQWLKNEGIIGEDKYQLYLEEYHSVDYVIENNIPFVHKRQTLTNRLWNKEIDNNQYYAEKQLTESLQESSSQKSTTTSAGASSVYVKYSIIAQNSGSTLTTNGKVIWKDVKNVEHPVKNALVEVIDEDITFDDYLGKTITNSNGEFSFTFQNQTGWNEKGCDVFFKIYARTSDVLVHGIAQDGTGYFFQTEPDDNVKTTITNKIQGITNTDVAKAFSVMQALHEGTSYAKAIDSSETYFVSAYFPSATSVGTCYEGSTNTINILGDDYCDWDVILHEFGHYIANVLDIDKSPGGRHETQIDLFDMLGDKNKAIRLAWSEGWATYLSIASQRYLSLSGIPNVGDYYYTDTIDSTNNYNIKSPRSIGETNEIDVSYMLIMLNDYYNSLTGVNGFRYIWMVAKDSGSSSFSEFYKILTSKSENQYLSKLNKINLYAQNAHFSPSASMVYNSSVKSLSVSISTIGNSKLAYSYFLQFADMSMKNPHIIILNPAAKSYTFEGEDLNALKEEYPDGFVWWVSVECTSAPLTGAYHSQVRSFDVSVLS